MAIEQFNPNIKNPGINKPTGAYARGDIGEQADWSEVYNAINESVTNMMGAIGQTVAIDKALLSTLTEKCDKLKTGIANLQESGNSVLNTAGDNIISGVSNGEKKEWSELNRREKKEAIKRLDQVQGVKDVITGVVGDIGTGNINDLDWSNFTKNPKVKSFFNHVINGEAIEGQQLFDINMDGQDIKIKWQGQEMDLQDLQSGSSIFKSAKEGKKSIKDLLDAAVTTGIKRRDSLAKNTDGIGGGKVMDMQEFNREQMDMIKDLSEDGDNYEFIFNNFTHTIDPNNRVTAYDPTNKQHVEDVETWISNYISNGMGEAPQVARSADEVQAAKDRAAGKTNIGGRTVSADVVSRARGLVPVLQGLTSHTEGTLGALPEMNRSDFEIIKGLRDNKDAKQTTRDLYSAINSARGTLQKGDRYLNEVVEKYNSGGVNALNGEERDVISAYKRHIGAFDETTDLTQYFDPRAIDRSSPVNYNRIDKTITLKLPGADSPQEFDLKNYNELTRVTELMMNVQGLNQVEGGYVLKHLFQNATENNIFTTDPNKPKLQ